MKVSVVFILVLFISANLSFSQANIGAGFAGNKGLGPLVKWESKDHHLLSFFDKAKVFGIGTKDTKLKGSLFLFEGWDNNGIIQIADKRFVLNNINFNIEKDAFMSKMEGDSIIIFDSSYLDDIKINNKPFKYVYNVSEGKGKTYEVIHQLKNGTTILKGYYLKVILASPNPMLNRPLDEIKKRSQYYVLKEGNLSDLKLQKKAILRLIDESDIEKVKKFVNKSNLSFKDEKDLIRIFKYHDSL